MNNRGTTRPASRILVTGTVRRNVDGARIGWHIGLSDYPRDSCIVFCSVSATRRQSRGPLEFDSLSRPQAHTPNLIRHASISLFHYGRCTPCRLQNPTSSISSNPPCSGQPYSEILFLSRCRPPLIDPSQDFLSPSDRIGDGAHCDRKPAPQRQDYSNRSLYFYLGSTIILNLVGLLCTRSLCRSLGKG